MSEKVLHAFQSAKLDGGDAALVRPSNWNAAHTVATEMTNKSGGTLSVGDVVVFDTTADEAVALTTSIAAGQCIAVALETITNDNVGKFQTRGICDTVNVQGAVSRGDYLRTSASSGRAEAIPGVATDGAIAKGAFAYALSSFAGPGSGTVKAYLFGNTIRTPFKKGSDVASAATLSLDASAQYFHVTGTTTITSLGSNHDVGTLLVLEFDGALTITHNASSLILADGADVATTAGQVFGFVCESVGNWREVFRTSGSFDPKIKMQFYEDFLSTNLPLSEPTGGAFASQHSWFYTLNTGISLDGINGIISLGNNDSVLLTNGGSSSLALAFSASKNPKVKIRTAQNGTQISTRRIGLCSANLSADPTNGIYFRHTAGGNYIAVCRSGGSESTIDTGVAAANGAFHTLELLISSSSVSVIVDGASKGTISSNIPSADLGISFANNLKVDYIFIEQSR